MLDIKTHLPLNRVINVSQWGVLVVGLLIYWAGDFIGRDLSRITVIFTCIAIYSSLALLGALALKSARLWQGWDVRLADSRIGYWLIFLIWALALALAIFILYAQDIN